MAKENKIKNFWTGKIQKIKEYKIKKSGEKKIKKWPIVKWSIGLLLLIAGIIFVGVNSDLCYNEYETPKVKGKDVVYLNSDSVCEQKFKGYNGTLEVMRIYMDNQGREDSEGKIKLEIKNESGKVIGTTSREMKKIQTRKFIRFEFEEQPELEKGKTYTLVVKCVNAYNPQKFGVYTSTAENEWLKDGAVVDGNHVADNGKLRIRMIFRYYDSKSMTFMVFMMIMALIATLVPLDYIGNIIGKKINKNVTVDIWFSRILFIFAPIVAYYIMESLSGFSVIEITKFLLLPKGILNVGLYCALLAIFYAVTNKTQYSAVLLWTVTLIFGLTNYFVFKFRGVPVLAADLLSVGTAMNVAGSFEYDFDICVLWAVSIFASFSGFMFSRIPYRGFRWIKRAGVIAVTVVIVIFANYFYVGSDIVPQWNIEDSQWKPQLTYAENGSMLSFATSWKYVKTDKPDGYSIKDIEKIAKNYKSDETDKNAAKTKKMPNVIAIMNESLGDLDYDGKLETTEDYLPFIRGMKDNTIKGKLYVSIEGANTANSEFEFLTGNSLAFFAPRSVPYNNYVQGIVPSLTRTLAAQGYVGNNAYHPYRRNGWNRPHVYNCLGFNYFYSDEHYKGATFVRNFISDKSNMEQIIADYEEARKESSDPFYLFNVTVQNHGGYVGNRGFIDAEIKPTDSRLKDSAVNQYLTLAKLSDEAFEELIQYFEKIEEPTVIVMFGDHQPPLSNEFYSSLVGTDVNNFTTEQTANWYSTPYVIWANYDIEEKQNFDMSANYLSSYLLQIIGADMTGYNKYLLDLHKEIPVITGLFYAGDDGKFRNIDETSDYTELLNEYSKIQYNGLFDKKNRVDDFFFLKDGDYEVPEYDEQ